MDITRIHLIHTIKENVKVKYGDIRSNTAIEKFIYRFVTSSRDNTNPDNADTVELSLIPRLASNFILESGQITETGSDYLGIFLLPYDENETDPTKNVSAVSPGDIIERIAKPIPNRDKEYETLVVTETFPLLGIMQVMLQVERGQRG